MRCKELIEALGGSGVASLKEMSSTSGQGPHSSSLMKMGGEVKSLARKCWGDGYFAFRLAPLYSLSR